jgi:hypothetical protein
MRQPREAASRLGIWLHRIVMRMAAFSNQGEGAQCPLQHFVVPVQMAPYTLIMLRNPSILDRVIASKRGGFPLDFAKQVLGFGFPPRDLARYEKLSYKAQSKSLTEKERAELEDYLNVNDLLMVLKAKAQASLRNQSPAA